MLQNVLKLEGAKKLSTQAQKELNGGRRNPLSLCVAAVIQCAGERVYDPCGAITQTNYPC
jgi:hypothetical protein